MGKIVNVRAIYNMVEDIDKQIEDRKKEISAMEDKMYEIRQLNNDIQEFDCDLVAGSRRRDIIKNKEYADQWRIIGLESESDYLDQCQIRFKQLEDKLVEIGALNFMIKQCADEIVQHIKAMEKELEEGVDKKVPTSTSAFDILSKSISYSADEAQKGKKIDQSEIMEEYWKDAKLSFKKQENGTYAIVKKDENGVPIIMGYTTGTAATAYLNEIKQNKKSSDTKAYTVSAEEQAKKAQAVGKGPKAQTSKTVATDKTSTSEKSFMKEVAEKHGIEPNLDNKASKQMKDIAKKHGIEPNLDNDATKLMKDIKSKQEANSKNTTSNNKPTKKASPNLMKDIAEKHGIKPNIDNKASKQMKDIAKKHGIEPNLDNDASKFMKDVKGKVTPQKSTGASPQADGPSPINVKSQQKNTAPQWKGMGASPQADGPSFAHTKTQTKDASTLMSDIAKEKGITPKNDDFFGKFKK